MSWYASIKFHVLLGIYRAYDMRLVNCSVALSSSSSAAELSGFTAASELGREQGITGGRQDEPPAAGLSPALTHTHNWCFQCPTTAVNSSLHSLTWEQPAKGSHSNTDLKSIWFVFWSVWTGSLLQRRQPIRENKRFYSSTPQPWGREAEMMETWQELVLP